MTAFVSGNWKTRLRERMAVLGKPSLLVVDYIGSLPYLRQRHNLFFQVVNGRYEKGSIILTFNS